LDEASAANPATEPDGITRAVVISSVGWGWADFEGNSEDTNVLSNGFLYFTRTAPLAGKGTMKDGYYEVTDRNALQALVDGAAATAAVQRVVRTTVDMGNLSMVPSQSVTIHYGKETIQLPHQLFAPSTPAVKYLGKKEPPGLGRPDIVKGHHLADVKVLHAARERALDCIATFDHKQATLFAAELRQHPPPRSFVTDAITQLPPSCADVANTLKMMLVTLPPDVPSSPEAVHPTTDARVPRRPSTRSWVQSRAAHRSRTRSEWLPVPSRDSVHVTCMARPKI